MTGFGRRFVGAVFIGGGITLITLDIFIQFTFEHFRIDAESSALPYILGVIVAAAVVFPSIAALYGIIFAKYFKAREYTLKIGSDIAFFRNYTVASSIFICINMIFLYKKSQPFFEAAYADAQMRIKILDCEPKAEKAKLHLLEISYEKLLNIVLIAVVIACIIQAAILLLSARRIVRAYRSQRSILLNK